MTPFGIRRRLKDLVQRTFSGKAEAPPAAPPKPTPPPPVAAASKPPPPRPVTPKPMSATPSAGLPKGTMWVQVARLDQVVPGTVRRVDALGSKVALVSVGADLYALDDECPHAGGPLADGELDGLVLTCPHHGFSFDVRNGDCTSGAAAKATPRRVKVEGELVLVEVPDA